MYTGLVLISVVQGFWEVNMDDIIGNGQTILSNILTIIDTGTSLITGNPNDVAALYSALGGTDASNTVGSGFYTCTSAVISFPLPPLKHYSPMRLFP